MTKELIYVFSFAGFVESVRLQKTTTEEIDIVLLLISLVCCLCGGLYQVFEKGNAKNINLKILFSIPVISLISWAIGYWLDMWFITAIIATVGGAASLDFLPSLFGAVIKITKSIPELFSKFAQKKINGNE